MAVLNSNLPAITIVTPSFNQGRFITRTIESVLNQNYPRLEYIVIDGGSSDETMDILRRYEGRLRWISERDSGQSEAINKGFRMARGEILAWLNSDDIYLPGALIKVARYFLEHAEISMAYGEGNIIDQDDGVMNRFPFTEPRFDLARLIYHGDYILQQSCFFRRSVLDEIGMLDETLHYGMDWDLFIRIGKRFRVGYIPEYLGCIREHRSAKTSTGGRKRFRELVQVIRRHGILKYPASFWNYAWDAYGKTWFGQAEGGSGVTTLGVTLLGSGTRVLRSFLSAGVGYVGQGMYSDGWVGKRVMVVIPAIAPRKTDANLVVEAEAHSHNVPFEIEILMNGKKVGRNRVDKPGAFTLTVDHMTVTGLDGCVHLEFRASRTFVPAKLGFSTDHRRLAFVFKKVNLSE